MSEIFDPLQKSMIKYTKEVARRRLHINVDVTFDDYLSNSGVSITGKANIPRNLITYHGKIFNSGIKLEIGLIDRAWHVMMHEICHFEIIPHGTLFNKKLNMIKKAEKSTKMKFEQSLEKLVQ